METFEYKGILKNTTTKISFDYKTSTLLNLVQCIINTNKLRIYFSNYVNIYCCIAIITIFAECVIVPATCAGFIKIRKFNNPAKLYYFTIEISIFLSFISYDLVYSYPALCKNVVYQFSLDSIICLPFLTQYPYQKIPFLSCVCLYIGNISQSCQYITTAIFCIHRTLIVLFPFKIYLINKVFSKWMIIIIIIIIGIVYMPTNVISQFNYVCTNGAVSALYNGFFDQVYPVILIYFKFLIPLICIVFGTLIIVIKLKISSIGRSKLFYHSKWQMNRNETKTLSILLISNIVYIICMFPNSILQITVFLNNTYNYCETISSYILSITAATNTIRQHNYSMIRVADSLIFVIMIPELKQSVIKLLYCK